MTLIEALIAMVVLLVGALGVAAVFLQGARLVVSAPNELIATQKAAEAVESVYGARDSHTVQWAQLRNTTHGGVFLTGAQPMKVAGADGIVNTADDGAIESVLLPGDDQLLGTADDKTESLTTFTREIRIDDVSPDLRSITVIITYLVGGATERYTLSAYISAYV